MVPKNSTAYSISELRKFSGIGVNLKQSLIISNRKRELEETLR